MTLFAGSTLSKGICSPTRLQEATLRCCRPRDLIKEVPKSERKPNPALLTDICNREGFSLADACYLGDSLVRDISMAKAAGVTAIWARYGTLFPPNHWQTLVAITHWTPEDVSRETKLRDSLGEIRPDFVIEQFSSLHSIMRNKQTHRLLA